MGHADQQKAQQPQGEPSRAGDARPRRSGHLDGEAPPEQEREQDEELSLKQPLDGNLGDKVDAYRSLQHAFERLGQEGHIDHADAQQRQSTDSVDFPCPCH